MGGIQNQVTENSVTLKKSEKLSRDRKLSDRVYELILKKIVSGEISVGEKLATEHTLSTELQVSRPVLRQALKQLRDDGVIVSRQGSGSFVQRRPDGSVLDIAPVGSIADIQRIFEFRSAIEGEATFLAAQRRSDKDIQDLKTALTTLDCCIREGKLGVDADEEFHEIICAASGNPYFEAARSSMKVHILTGINLTRNLSLRKPQERLELVQREHYNILDAIIASDAIAARNAMRDHIENARKRVFEG
jgi:DNA-binding FadR family transcriptional regulator